MKKNKSLVNKVLLIFFMVFLGFLGVYSLAYKDISVEQIIEASNIEKDNVTVNTFNYNVYSNDHSDIMDKLIVFQEDIYDKEEANKMINRLEKIPQPILEDLYKEDVKIILSNTNITEIDEYKHLKGVTPRGWEGTGRTWDDVPGAGGKPVVARIGYSEPGEAHDAINLELHETAHAIDAYVFNEISSTRSFKDIWRAEVTSLFGDNPYFVNYPEEYFAETFAMYYLDENKKGELREKAPLTYKVMKNLEYAIEK